MQRKGFTLIEVLTVIIIIGILSTLTVYVYNSSLIRSRDYQRLTDMQTIKNGLEQFYLDARHYPLMGENDEKLTIAKLQLDKSLASDCPASDPQAKEEEFLAPGFLSSVPEDPLFKFIPEIGRKGESCTFESGQAGHYLYIPNVPADDRKNTPPGFFLVAKMEREMNMSGEIIDQDMVGYWWSYINELKFCMAGGDQPGECTHNYYLSEDKEY